MSPLLDGTNVLSCSLPCFKIHKEQCTLKPTEPTPEAPSILPKTSNVASEAPLPIKVEKEYALLSPSQLSLLRTPSPWTRAEE